MTNKAYIVANEEQEREVLEKLEREGITWPGGEKPTEWIPVQETNFCHLPYALITNGHVGWLSLSQLTDEEIVFDGRNESKMNEKYVVSQEFMNELEEWKDELNVIDGSLYISTDDFRDLPTNILKWRDDSKYTNENNNRLIAIIRWVNGEDVFEVEKHKKWIVRSKYSGEAGEHLYVMLFIGRGIKDTTTLWGINNATKFDTKEEAKSWANAHQEVVQVEVKE